MPALRLVTLTSIFLLLVSCLGDGTQYVPDAFAPYVAEFFQEANARGYELQLEDYTISIVFRELPPDRSGECNWTGQHQIRIDADHWVRMDEEERRWVMFHELGHCILERQHRSFADDHGLCFSIMNSLREVRCVANIYDASWWKYLVDELFDPTLTTEATREELEEPYASAPFDSELIWHETDTVMNHGFGIEGFSTGRLEGRDFSIKMTADFREGRPSVMIGVGNIRFSYCECEVEAISIFRRQTGDLFSANFTVEGPAVLEIQRRNDKLLFYLNEHYVYTAPASIIGEIAMPRARHRNFPPFEGAPLFDLEVRAW